MLLKKILEHNLLIYMYLHCARCVSWCTTTLDTLAPIHENASNYFLEFRIFMFVACTNKKANFHGKVAPNSWHIVVLPGATKLYFKGYEIDFIRNMSQALSKCLSERIIWIISIISARISKILFYKGSYETLAMLKEWPHFVGFNLVK